MRVKRNFVKTSVEEVEQLRAERHEPETNKATIWGVTLFRGKSII